MQIGLLNNYDLVSFIAPDAILHLSKEHLLNGKNLRERIIVHIRADVWNMTVLMPMYEGADQSYDLFVHFWSGFWIKNW